MRLPVELAAFISVIISSPKASPFEARWGKGNWNAFFILLTAASLTQALH